MRRFFIVFSLLSVLSLVQGILRGLVVVHGIVLVPDFALIFLVLFSIEFGRGVGQSAGWFGGLLEDFAMAQPLGVMALIKMLLGSIFGALQGRFMVGAVIIAFWTVAAATIMKYGLTWGIAKMFNLDVFSISQIFPHLVTELALNLLITLPSFWLIKKIIKSAASFIRHEQKI